MRRIARNGIALVAVVLGLASVVAWGGQMRLGRESPGPGLYKDVTNPDGSPVTQPMHIGQTIQHVIYYNPPTSGNSGPISIVDTLSANQTYVPGSIVAPPGWTWTTPPYGVGNTTTYSHPGYGPGTSFIVNVPVSGSSSSGSTGGDGFIPILTGGNFYSNYHHQFFGSAQIMCWNAASLTPCSGTWPKSVGTDIGTPSENVHVISGGRIYFPASHKLSATSAEPGIGCWDTGTEAPCPFITLIGNPSWSSPLSGSSLDNFMGGVAGNKEVNPNRVFVEANGTVYCANVPSGAPCTGWTPQALATGGPARHGLMLEPGVPNPQRLYVLHGGTGGGSVSCLSVVTGLPCSSGWYNKPLTASATYATLTPFLTLTGAFSRVCAIGYGAPVACFNASTGADETSSLPPAFVSFFGTRQVWTSLQIPGTKRVIYGNRVAPPCWDFGTGTNGGPCAASDFTPGWTTQFSDYGYRPDPASPKSCLFGLGDAGKPFRFTAKGGFGPVDGCAAHFATDFDFDAVADQYFCGKKPTTMTWRSIAILGRPAELTGGTMRIVDMNNNTVQTIAVTAANSYLLGIPASGATRTVTLQFDPIYSSTPANGYQLEIGFDADVHPQICYQATVDRCGPVTNKADMHGELLGYRVPHGQTVLRGAICKGTY